MALTISLYTMYMNMKILYNFINYGFILIFLTIPLLFLMAVSTNLHAKEVYQWTDSEGTTHITDNKAKIPEQFSSTAKQLNWNGSKNDQNTFKDTLDGSDTEVFDIPVVDEIVDTEHERELRKEWRAKAVAIEEEEKEIKYKLERAKEEQKYKKRVVDWMLINGYSADSDINELKGLEKYIKDLEEELTTIQPKIDALRIEARKAEIPEGYLRE